MFGLDESHHPKVARLTLAGERFVKRALLNDRSRGSQLVVHGPTGIGKTTVARRVARYFRSRAIDAWLSRYWRGPSVPSVETVDWPTFTAKDREDHFEDTLFDIETASLVVLDDVGAEVDRFRSELSNERLRRVLELCRNKWLLVTTNVAGNQWDTRFDPRAASRLRAAHYLDLTGVPDYRPRLSA